MKSNQPSPNNDDLSLDRRTFLQIAGLTAGAASLGALATNVISARADDAGMAADSYPAAPKLTTQALKPTTLATEGISRKTHEEHFKLYEGYVKKTNELFEKISKVSRDPKGANGTYSDIRELKVELSFALGGVKNHELYF